MHILLSLKIGCQQLSIMHAQAFGNNGLGGAGKRFSMAGADTQKKRMKLIIQETERRTGPDIDMLKELQRTDPIGREQWWAFCDCHGEGVRDPGKHPVSFVQDFLDKYGSGMRFTSPRVNMMPELVKEGERRSSVFKEAWVSYVASFGSSMKDPSKHEESFLVGFMDFLGQRAWMAMSAATTGMLPASAMPQPPQAQPPNLRGDQPQQQFPIDFSQFGTAAFGGAAAGAVGASLAEQLSRLQANSHLLGGAGMAIPGYGDSLAAAVAGMGTTIGGSLASGSPLSLGTMPAAISGNASSAYSLQGAYSAATLGGAVNSAYGSLAGTSPALGSGAGAALNNAAAAYSAGYASAGPVTDPAAAYAAAYAAAASQQAAAAAAAGGAGGYDALSAYLAAALQAHTTGATAAPQAYAVPNAAPQAYALPGTESVPAAQPYAPPEAAVGAALHAQVAAGTVQEAAAGLAQ